MITPEIVRIQSFADLPLPRAGGVIYMVCDGHDGGLGTYLAAKGLEIQSLAVEATTLGDYYGTSVRTLPSATRLVVAVGGRCAMEVGKLLAKLHRLPLWCVPLDYVGAALWCHTLWTVGKTPTFVQCAPHTTFLCATTQPTRDGVQQTYQYLFAAYMGLSCEVYRNRMFGKEGDNPPLVALAADAKRALLACTEYNAEAGEALWRALSACAGAPIQEIETLALAICVYKKGNMSYNRYIFAAAYALGRALADCPDMPDLLLPPARPSVVEAIGRLGWVAQAQPTATAPKVDWAWRDFAQDYRRETDDMSTMAKYWRRLAGGAGYGYFEDLTAAEVVALLPVVAEIHPTYTPLKHLYLRGNLNLFV